MLNNLLSSFGDYCSSYFCVSKSSPKNDLWRNQAILHSLSEHIENNDTTAIRSLLATAEDRRLIAAALAEPASALLHRIVVESRVDVLKSIIDTLPLAALKIRRPDTGRTLFMEAAQSDNEEMLFTLCVALTTKIDAEYPDPGDPDNPLVFHHEPGWIEYQTILNAQDQHGNTALMLAIRAENIACVTLLDVYRSDFLIENYNGQSALALVEHLTHNSPLANRIRMRHAVQRRHSVPKAAP